MGRKKSVILQKTSFLPSEQHLAELREKMLPENDDSFASTEDGWYKLSPGAHMRIRTSDPFNRSSE